MPDYTDMYKAIEEHIIGFYGTTTPIDWEDIPFESEGVPEFIAVYIAPSISDKTDIGDNGSTIGGIITIQIFTEKSKGWTRSNVLLDIVSAGMKNKELLGGNLLFMQPVPIPVPLGRMKQQNVVTEFMFSHHE